VLESPDVLPVFEKAGLVVFHLAPPSLWTVGETPSENDALPAARIDEQPNRLTPRVRVNPGF
jgi:hypothetical protein